MKDYEKEAAEALLAFGFPDELRAPRRPHSGHRNRKPYDYAKVKALRKLQKVSRRANRR